VLPLQSARKPATECPLRQRGKADRVKSLEPRAQGAVILREWQVRRQVSLTRIGLQLPYRVCGCLCGFSGCQKRARPDQRYPVVAGFRKRRHHPRQQRYVAYGAWVGLLLRNLQLAAQCPAPLRYLA